MNPGVIAVGSSFDELLAHRVVLQAAADAFWETRHAQQVALEAAFIAAAKQKGGKRVTMKNLEKHLAPEEIAAVRASFQKTWDEGYTATRDPLDANKLAMQTASEAAEFPAVETRTQWLLFTSVWTSTYGSQGYGCTTYTRNDAESRADKARAYGIEVEVRAVMLPKDRVRGQYSVTDVSSFDVYVKVASQRDVELLKHKPEESLREWVRRQWARGSNPRVSNPFLPHGYEEREGLDYFGNDLRITPNAGPYRGTP